jgi:hypothetical protein
MTFGRQTNSVYQNEAGKGVAVVSDNMLSASETKLDIRPVCALQA